MTLDSFDSQMIGAQRRKREKAEKNVVEAIAEMRHLIETIYLCKQKVSLIP